MTACINDLHVGVDIWHKRICGTNSKLMLILQLCRR